MTLNIGKSTSYETEEISRNRCACGKPAVSVMDMMTTGPGGRASRAFLCLDCTLGYLDRSGLAEHMALASRIRGDES